MSETYTLEEIKEKLEHEKYLRKENQELYEEKNRLNNIIKALEKYVIGEQISEYGDTLEEAKEYLEKLKRS